MQSKTNESNFDNAGRHVCVASLHHYAYLGATLGARLHYLIKHYVILATWPFDHSIQDDGTVNCIIPSNCAKV